MATQTEMDLERMKQEARDMAIKTEADWAGLKQELKSAQAECERVRRLMEGFQDEAKRNMDLALALNEEIEHLRDLVEIMENEGRRNVVLAWVAGFLVGAGLHVLGIF